MPTISIREALAENEERKADMCALCNSPAHEDTEPYCVYCSSYLEDVQAGIFDDLEDQHHDQ